MKRVVLGIFMLGLVGSMGSAARGAEGMYPLTGVEALPLRQLKKAGVELRGREIIDVSKAVVQVAGGGTGSFVSSDGLVVTNHHVAYGCLAALDATEEHAGILDSGYVAENRAGELACPSYYLLLLERTEDITQEVRAASDGLTDYHARYEAERAKKGELEKACEADGTRVCQAGSLNGGTVEQLSVYRRIRDVRLVYAPEKSIGKYGGDVDNWMYPRHTGDFSFLRAYASPDGALGSYDEANVPFQPEHFLRVTAEGVKRGDVVVVMGFPGRTQRFATAAGARFYVEHSIPASLALYGPMVKILEGLSEVYSGVARRYASLVAGLNNATKYYGELRAGIEATDLLARKVEQQAALRAGLKGKDLAAFDATLAEMERLYGEYAAVYRTYYLLERMAHLGTATVSTAYDLHKWSVEKQKPNAKRKNARYKDKNFDMVRGLAERLELRADRRAETALLTYYLQQAGALPEGHGIQAVEKLLAETQALLDEAGGLVDAEAPTLYDVVQREYGIALPDEPAAQAAALLLARTEVISFGRDAEAIEAAKARRNGWFDMAGPSFAEEVRDPLVCFARALDKELVALEEGPMREVQERLATELQREWVAAIKAPYPDANFTLRLSYGTVEDYTATATGKTFGYLTTLGEMLAKETGVWPFVVPPKVKEAAAGDKGQWVDEVVEDVPVNFTSTLDTTGGNSGSPVVDARGRLVGLLFDGTSESILSDWQYLEKDQRSICLDIRYALFLADKVHGARELLIELGF